MKKNKFIYISFFDADSKEGINKKIFSQIKAIEKIVNTKCGYTGIEKNYMFVKTGTGILLYFGAKKAKNILNNMFLFENLRKKNVVLESDFFYIRHSGATREAYLFFKEIKKKNKKIILEIPTYPYDREIEKKISSKITAYIDKKYRKKYKNYVDYIVTFSEDAEIWGIPCINISNGIDLDDTKIINKVEDDVLTFTSVSICAAWHGIDRFLNSLDNYLKQNTTRKVKFNIVGEGVETNKLKKIVNDSSHLSKNVIFHGFKSGEELDAIYNETDIAVGSLGRHRSGLTSLKTLKNREYAAKGLPMIYSEIDTDFEEQPFVYKVTPDEALIDLNKVIAWHQKLEMQPEKIREYAKQFSWDTQMKKIIDEVQK